MNLSNNSDCVLEWEYEIITKFGTVKKCRLPIHSKNLAAEKVGVDIGMVKNFIVTPVTIGERNGSKTNNNKK